MISQYDALNDAEKICVTDAAPNITSAMRISENLKANMVCMAHVLNTAQKLAAEREECQALKTVIKNAKTWQEDFIKVLLT